MFKISTSIRTPGDKQTRRTRNQKEKSTDRDPESQKSQRENRTVLKHRRKRCHKMHIYQYTVYHWSMQKPVKHRSKPDKQFWQNENTCKNQHICKKQTANTEHDLRKVNKTEIQGKRQQRNEKDGILGESLKEQTILDYEFMYMHNKSMWHFIVSMFVIFLAFQI